MTASAQERRPNTALTIKDKLKMRPQAAGTMAIKRTRSPHPMPFKKSEPDKVSGSLHRIINCTQT